MTDRGPNGVAPSASPSSRAPSPERSLPDASALEAPAAELPESLAQIRDDFLELEQRDRLQLLLEFSQELPELPERFADHPDLLERVAECQSPVFIFVEVEGGIVHLHATAPKEAPTTRGFASILVQGLAGLTVEQVLAVPPDYPLTLGLTEAVSPLRIRGMSGLLGRTQRQVRERIAA
jgi:cysteine desulfuration protein SufE